MNRSGYNVIWKMEDVKQYEALWAFTDSDLLDIFVNGVDKDWYDIFLNDVVEDIVMGHKKPSIEKTSEWTSSTTSMTDDEYDAYIEWSEQSYNLNPKRPTINFDFVFEPENDFGITVTLVGDKLAITSEDVVVLDSIKEIFIKAGNICCDHHKKSHKDIMFHTYVFQIKNQL